MTAFQSSIHDSRILASIRIWLIGSCLLLAFSCSRQPQLDPEVDTFLSYVQAVHGLSNELLNVKSPLELRAKLSAFEMACSEVEGLEA